MNIKRAFLVRLICLVQACIHSLADTSDCRKDPKKAADDFDRQIKAWFDYVLPFRENLMARMEKKLQEMKTNPNCIAKYYSAYNVREFGLLGISVCGLVPVMHNDGPWIKNPKASDEEICNYLEVQGAIALEYANYNLKTLPNCKNYEWFIRIFYESWRECNEKCGGGSY